MARPDFPRTIVEFQQRFSDEAACLEYLAASRWPGGYRCPACGRDRAWVLERRHLWECASCHYQASVTAGTVMHGTRTPLRLWFWAAYLVATHTSGISAKQLQRQFGLRCARHQRGAAAEQDLLGALWGHAIAGSLRAAGVAPRSPAAKEGRRQLHQHSVVP